MTRVLAFIFHNWPLKLAAVALATVLYVALALSQNAREWPGPLTIDVVNQPASAVLQGALPPVTNVRYFAPPDIRVSSASFLARIDLAGATPDASGLATVAVNVTSPDDQIRVIDWSPRQVGVRLDPLRTKTVPVVVDRGSVPAGLQVRDPVVDTSEVTVSGSQSVVSQVTQAVARVRIDAYPNQTFHGVVTEVGSSPILPAAGAAGNAIKFLVKVQIKDPPPDIKPGLSVQSGSSLPASA